MKVHKGDTVLVISGKDKGAKGKVLRGLPDPQQDPRRGRQPDQEAHPGVTHRAWCVARAASSRRRRRSTCRNVMVVDSDGKPTRIGYRKDDETGKNVRIAKTQRQGHLR